MKGSDVIMKGSDVIMKGRSTVYTKHTTPEKLSQCNPENIQLEQDFLDYLASIDRSPKTILNYKNDLEIFWCFTLDYLNNKYFVDLTKREVSKFQSHAINKWGWSPNRIRRVKSTLSSLSNYIENILDDEIENFKPIIRKIENPVIEKVREKTVLTEEQLTFLLDTLVNSKKYETACAVALAAFSGARKAELGRFKVEYFKDENIIYDAMWRTPEKIKTKGRGGKIGKPLTKYVLLDFKKYLDLWLAERERLGIDSEWLLTTKEKNEWVQIKISTLDSYADTCTRILGVPFYFHCTRHMLCTAMVSKYNLPPQIIQEYFGWSNQDMVGVYSDNDASDDFGKYFGADGIKKAENKSLSDL
jgi:integrase